MREGDGTSSASGLGRHVPLVLEGEIDMTATGDAYRRMLGLDLRPGDQLVVDLREATFMDSAGIRLILQARAHAERRRAGLVVVRGPQPVMRALELVGLDEQLELVDGVG
jgi:anti-anti-sigma factor